MDISGFEDTFDLSQGEWVDAFPVAGMDGVKLLVRSANYGPYQTARDRIFRAIFTMKDKFKGMSEDEQEEALLLVVAPEMAKHLLLDWDGVTSGDKDLPFDVDVAAKLLAANDPHGIGRTFRKSVEFASLKVAHDIRTRSEDLAKN